MSAVSHALRPNPVERALRSGVILYVVVLVAVPLVGLVQFGLADGLATFWARAMSPVARAALWLALWSALLVGGINTLFGTATAWILVRYRLPGRALVSALVDLPLAVPTLVAGVMLATLYGPTSLVGTRLEAWGFEVVFARPGIVLALLFVTLPFVVRAVEPVLAELDPAEEEAAIVLGAGPVKTFRTVFLPAILPAALSGGIRSLGRALGEFGSVVVVAGNIPFETLTAPVFIFGEIESGAPRAAAATSTLLLLFALLVHAGARVLELRTGARHATR
ncbi:MAG TPA: sulfate ABC transporter permease subunit [Polyangiaceae bacterium]|nr:sulfate ABC transporter permease subunit [Polyangiaceae bacterium]